MLLVDVHFGRRDFIHTPGRRLKGVTPARRQTINAKLAEQHRLQLSRLPGSQHVPFSLKTYSWNKSQSVVAWSIEKKKPSNQTLS